MAVIGCRGDGWRRFTLPLRLGTDPGVGVAVSLNKFIFILIL